MKKELHNAIVGTAIVLVIGIVSVITVMGYRTGIFGSRSVTVKTNNEFYTFTNFADDSPVYIRKDCLCTITTVSGDVYIVPTNGSSVRVKESLDEVREIVKIK